MPYIERGRRVSLDAGGEPENVGELTYCYTQALLTAENHLALYECLRRLTESYKDRNGLRFETLAAILGAITATGLEFDRRVGENLGAQVLLDFLAVFYMGTVAPYEDRKIEENGDVYP